MLRQNDEATHIEYFFIKLDDALSIEYDSESPMRINTTQDAYYSACVNCARPQCLYYYDDEFECEEFDDFASRRDDRVCPFDALYWDNDRQSIVIESDSCVGCGLCASRCPAGALYFDRGKMRVNLNRNPGSYEVAFSAEDASNRQRDCFDIIAGLPHRKHSVRKDFNRVDYVYTRLDDLKPNNDIALLFCRNLLIQNGYNCALSRTGVVSTRMDAIFTGHDLSGAVEIEFQGDSLSVARNLLDDMAMMQARNGLAVEHNTPLAICARIPNTRQGFYQVCDDMANVLGKRIRTVSIAALLLLVWNDVELDLSNDRFCLGFRDTSIREDIEALLGFNLEGNDESGYLEPIK